MNKRPSKSDIRNDIIRETEDFLRTGGEIKSCQRGETGLQNGTCGSSAISFQQKHETRTPVIDVLKAIDQRKQEKRPKTLIKRKQDKKKIIYDDFGEPLRIIWEES